jgi:hypothetical protein
MWHSCDTSTTCERSFQWPLRRHGFPAFGTP